MACVLTGRCRRRTFPSSQKGQLDSVGPEGWHCWAAQQEPGEPTCLASCVRRPSAGCKSSFVSGSPGNPSTLCPDCWPPPRHSLNPSLLPPGPTRGCPSPGPNNLLSPRSPHTGRQEGVEGEPGLAPGPAGPAGLGGPVLGSWCLHNPSGKGGGLMKTGRLRMGQIGKFSVTKK